MNDQEIINNLDLLLDWEDFSDDEIELIEKFDEVIDMDTQVLKSEVLEDKALQNSEVTNEK